MTLSEAADRVRELAAEVMEPWKEIHGIIWEVDGQHNRLGGLGIKTSSLQAHDAMLKLAGSLKASAERE